MACCLCGCRCCSDVVNCQRYSTWWPGIKSVEWQHARSCAKQRATNPGHVFDVKQLCRFRVTTSTSSSAPYLHNCFRTASTRTSTPQLWWIIKWVNSGRHKRWQSLWMDSMPEPASFPPSLSTITVEINRHASFEHIDCWHIHAGAFCVHIGDCGQSTVTVVQCTMRCTGKFTQVDRARVQEREREWERGHWLTEKHVYMRVVSTTESEYACGCIVCGRECYSVMK